MYDQTWGDVLATSDDALGTTDPYLESNFSSTRFTLRTRLLEIRASSDNQAGSYAVFISNQGSLLSDTPGDDVINGRHLVVAGLGNDTLFAPGSGPSGHDVIQFNGGVFTSFPDVTAHAVQAATNVVITDASGHTLLLANVTLASLVADDFRFA